MNETTTTVGYSTTVNGHSWLCANPNNTTITTASSNYSLSTAITNSNNMSKQVKVAVFTVERNDKNEVKSSKFVKEFWVEVKNGGSVVLAAARQLDRDFDPETTVVREIYSISF
jgi:flagellar hook assembly protein FlgD